MQDDFWTKAFEEYIKNLNIMNDVKEDDHTHEWKQYIGITRTYDYCECGEKKNVC